ncbi:MAG: hypothetical protein CVU98_01910 [Firmicutes bacterium HGW-Firmicutes-3]|jgi:hypothetical protein|nr:MAG: hypothetical protein CVU98_01910 [Firmicutes bacterium HGW-Firmicutes-3]
MKGSESMSYYKNLSAISMNDYKEMLTKMDLIKSRAILRENIDKQFLAIQEQGIENVEQLSNALKSKIKLEQFAKVSGIDMAYLTILIREINSLLPKANRFSDLPSLDEKVVKRLESAGYKDTYSIYEQINDKARLHKLVKILDIDSDVMDIIIKYVDISRIRWVNHTFAFVLLKVGYDTVEKIAHADSNALYAVIKAKNDKEHLYKGNIGIHDMEILIQWARWVQEYVQ